MTEEWTKDQEELSGLTKAEAKSVDKPKKQRVRKKKKPGLKR